MLGLVMLVVLAGCAAQADPAPEAGPPTATAPAPAAEPPLSRLAGPPAAEPLAGMPAVTDPHNVYAAAGAGMLAEPAKAATPLVYVPHTKSGDVWVIDPTTFA
ncbi:MAG TPA: hypothetical protein VNA11_20095, partial [Pseudonocardia sp.]|nr:hypothetical protein [Pseudonocardia sp.]